MKAIVFLLVFIILLLVKPSRVWGVACLNIVEETGFIADGMCLYSRKIMQAHFIYSRVGV